MTAPPSLVSPSIIKALVDMASKTPPGAFVELGVYRGGVAWHLAAVARRQQRQLFLYDTFMGIPLKDEIDHHEIGDFGDTSLAEVREAIPDAVYCVGVFPKTLVDMGPIAFAHVDCDQYASVKAACEVLGPLMVTGGVMWFDDYGYLEGATRALDEAFPGRIVMQSCGRPAVFFGIEQKAAD